MTAANPSDQSQQRDGDRAEPNYRPCKSSVFSRIDFLWALQGNNSETGLLIIYWPNNKVGLKICSLKTGPELESWWWECGLGQSQCENHALGGNKKGAFVDGLCATFAQMRVIQCKHFEHLPYNGHLWIERRVNDRVKGWSGQMLKVG